MSRIDELIMEHCPAGVRYMPLGETCQIKNGRDWKTQEPGRIPVYGSGGRMDVKVKQPAYHQPTLLLPRKGSLNVQYVSEPFWNVDTVFYTICDLQLMEPKFLFHFMKTVDLGPISTSSTRPSLTQSALAKLRVPVPPLEIQRAIVDILDKFTKLEAELEAELEARTKQYEHYRHRLVSISQAGQKLSLGELEDRGVIKLGRGKVISKVALAEKPGDYPVYSSSGMGTGEFGRYGLYMFDDERITWSVDGGGRFFYRHPHKFSVTNVSGWMTVDSSMIRVKYLYYVLTVQWEKQSFDYTRKAHPSVIRNVYEVYIPPLDEQDELVAKLDQFDTLVNDLSSGLPAEIAARRKQYEYYRDQLLTFKELAS